MPGGNPTFHYAGKFAITDSSKPEIILKQIEFFHNGKSLLKSSPVINPVREQPNENIGILFDFYSQQNIPVSNEMINAHLVDVRFLFIAKNDSFEIIKKDVELHRAY
jgi:hypothetical protein